MIFENTLSFAQSLDADDPLKSWRDEFIIPVHDGKEQVYLLGNSLGLQPKQTKTAIEQVLNQWGKYGVEGFFMGDQPWLDYHDQLTKPLAAIVGARPKEIVVMNQLTVNLHLMLVSFYRPKGKKRKIICEAKAFPSDQYTLETHIKHYGFDPEEIIIEVAPRAGEHTIRIEDVLAVIEQNKNELALVLWGGVNYYTGQVFDLEKITKAGHESDAFVGFDLAHAAGNIHLQLHDWNVDFACWCSYKYLNAGPGAIGGVYIHERFHADKSLPRFAGWWGYDKSTRFLMEKGFVPAASAEGWQLSTPSALLYASHKASLDIFEKAGWEAIQQKRILLNSYLWFVLEDVKDKVTFLTPSNAEERGCQVSMLTGENGKSIFDALTKKGFMIDWREPNVIRFAPVPLYNKFEEIWKLGATLRELL